ncbi:hypothetical protein BpHYR1_047213, partial [Brachionus plicatilis]
MDDGAHQEFFQTKKNKILKKSLIIIVAMLLDQLGIEKGGRSSVKRKNKILNEKRCSKLNEQNLCSSYGTCEEKSSAFSSDSHTRLRPSADLAKPALATNFIQKIKDFKKKFTKSEPSESIDLERFGRMSSINSSNSYASLNSLATILSNDHLPPHHTPNMILNYSLQLEPNRRSLAIDLISLENVKLPMSLLQSSVDLNVYIKIELLEPNRDIYANVAQKLCAKTRMIKNRANPVYEETFEFNCLNDLFDSLANFVESAPRFRLVFNVCNSNIFGRDQIIGLCVHTFTKEDLYLADNLDLQKSINRIYSKKIDLVDSK